MLGNHLLDEERARLVSKLPGASCFIDNLFYKQREWSQPARKAGLYVVNDNGWCLNGGFTQLMETLKKILNGHILQEGTHFGTR